MTKEQMLDLLRLLSALEAWSFAEKHQPPAYLLEALGEQVVLLSKEILK